MRLPIVLGLVLLGGLGGCTSTQHVRPTALPIIGPDGSPMLHLSCGAEEGRCYQLAGQRCPMGYDIDPTRGGPGNFLVRCRAAAAAPPANIASNRTLAPSPYALQETVQPWPTEPLAPSPYRESPSQYPPLAPGNAPTQPAKPPTSPAPSARPPGAPQDLGF